MKVKSFYAKNCKIFAIFCLFSHQVIASDFHSPRTTALGGAGHASPLLNDSIYLNPSYTSFLPVYSMSGNYQFFHDSIENRTRNNWGVSLQDGRTELFQAGVGLSRRLPLTMIHVGASKAIISRFGAGLGAKFFMNQEKQRSAQDMTFSTTGIVTKWFQTALIVDNILESDLGREHKMYREVTLGTKFNIFELLMVYADPHWIGSLPRGKKLGYELGLELTMLSDFYFRFGSYRNSMQPFLTEYTNGWALGLGWFGPKISVDYGFTRPQSKISQMAHNFGVTIYF